MPTNLSWIGKIHGTISHLGFGIHRCMGNRLAEMQLRVLWEEILAREMSIEVIAPPKRTLATAVRGFTEMMVQING